MTVIRRLEDPGDADTLPFAMVCTLLQALALDFPTALQVENPSPPRATGRAHALGAPLHDHARGLAPATATECLGITLAGLNQAITDLDAALEPAGLHTQRGFTGICIVPEQAPATEAAAPAERARRFTVLNHADRSLL